MTIRPTLDTAYLIHYYGQALQWSRLSGHSPFCWKYPRGLDINKGDLTLNWNEVTCKRCLARRPVPVNA